MVALMYPAEDAGDYPFVVGSLYDGNHKMPFAADPSAVGLRSQSEGPERYGNQLLMKDDANSEELRSVAPRYRTDLTGLEQSVENTERTYYKRKSSLSAPPDDAPEYLGQSEYKDLPSKSKKVCALRSVVGRIRETYGKKKGKERVSVSTYQGYQKKTTFSLRDDLDSPVKKKLKKKHKSVSLNTFLNDLPEELRLHRRTETPKGNAISWEVAENGSEVGAAIQEEEYARLAEKTHFKAEKQSDDASPHTGSGLKDLRTYLRYVDKIEEPPSNVTYTALTITQVGRDAYEDEIQPYRRAYELSEIGQDAYTVGPYQEAYTSIGKADALDRDAKGVLDVCEGEYKIHTFGDRVEICRAGASDDPLTQEGKKDKEFKTIDDLPDHYDTQYRSDGDKPLLILSKDGTVCIQAADGINIESGGDIQMQAGGSIKMSAEEKIEEKAEEEVSIEGDKEVSVVSKEIKIGKSNITEMIEMRSQHKHSSHKGLLTVDAKETMKIKNENIIISNAKFHNTNAMGHFINSVVGTKFSLVDTKTSALLDNKQALIDFGNAVVDAKNSVQDEGNKASTMKNTIANVRDEIGNVDSRVTGVKDAAMTMANGVIGQDAGAMYMAEKALEVNV